MNKTVYTTLISSLFISVSVSAMTDKDKIIELKKNAPDLVEVADSIMGIRNNACGSPSSDAQLLKIMQTDNMFPYFLGLKVISNSDSKSNGKYDYADAINYAAKNPLCNDTDAWISSIKNRLYNQKEKALQATGEAYLKMNSTKNKS